MAKQKQQDGTPAWHALEETAYHAYREWPVWLVLRERELSERIEPTPGAAEAAQPASLLDTIREDAKQKQQP